MAITVRQVMWQNFQASICCLVGTLKQILKFVTNIIAGVHFWNKQILCAKKHVTCVFILYIGVNIEKGQNVIGI